MSGCPFRSYIWPNRYLDSINTWHPQIHGSMPYLWHPKKTPFWATLGGRNTTSTPMEILWGGKHAISFPVSPIYHGARPRSLRFFSPWKLWWLLQKRSDFRLWEWLKNSFQPYIVSFRECIAWIYPPNSRIPVILHCLVKSPCGQRLAWPWRTGGRRLLADSPTKQKGCEPESIALNVPCWKKHRISVFRKINIYIYHYINIISICIRVILDNVHTLNVSLWGQKQFQLITNGHHPHHADINFANSYDFVLATSAWLFQQCAESCAASQKDPCLAMILLPCSRCTFHS